MGVSNRTLNKMVFKTLSTALLLLPFITGQPPPPEECCEMKMVGDFEYRFMMEGMPGLPATCMNACIYKRVDNGKMYCFAPGDLHVECEDEDVTGAPDSDSTPQLVITSTSTTPYSTTTTSTTTTALTTTTTARKTTTTTTAARKTTTTAATTTTTPMPGVCESIAYNILSDLTRDVDYYDDYRNCDQLGHDHESSDWQGPGWYRFPNFGRIPENKPETLRCNTRATGWIDGTHPTDIGVAKNLKICFHWAGNGCFWSNSASVINCGNFYMYNLENTPACHSRYCSEVADGQQRALPKYI